MESAYAIQAGPSSPVKQLGFNVREGLGPVARLLHPPPIKEATPAEESGEAESWALPARWVADSPLGLADEPSTRSSLSEATTTGFKGFQDYCEAGSFTLAGAQVLTENGRLEVVGTAHTCAGVRRLVKSVVRGLRAWQEPEASAEGLGGTYFFMDERGAKTAIVKPCDEEPLAPNNPKGFVGRALGEPGLKPTVRIGEAAMREVAAFLLDHGHFSAVPHTVLVRVTHNIFHVASSNSGGFLPNASTATTMSCSQGSEASTLTQMATTVCPQVAPLPSKLASLQEFVSHCSDTSEMGCSRFSVRDVHRIGILDLRLFNTDRHAGNILVRRSTGGSCANMTGLAHLDEQLELIPIDHGFCLPEALEPPYLEWLHWPQALIPFDEEELEYISQLDPAADVAFLRKELPWLPEGSLRTLEVATLLLTQCTAAGLTLAEIGAVASRPLVGLDEEPSQLEEICAAARAAVDAAPVDVCSGDSEGGEENLDSSSEGGGYSPPVDKASTAMVMGRRVPLQTSMSGDELLFDLDDDSVASSPMFRPPTRSPLARRVQSEGFLARNDKLGESLEEQSSLDSEAGRAEVAKSVATGMIMHRTAPHRMRSRQRRRGAAGNMKPSPVKAKQAYPPPVVGAAPGGMNSVFDGLDKVAWASFVRALKQQIRGALEVGSWKQEPTKARTSNAVFGMSCPRF